MTAQDIIVYGYGNPGRQDDGLGPLLIDKLEADNLAGVALDSNYQLNIEDAYEVAQGKAVIFVDASIDGGEPFTFEPVTASNEITFTTHSMAPNSVVALSQELYNRDLEAYILAIRGYEWEFDTPMTPKAEENLSAAYQFVREKLNDLMR